MELLRLPFPQEDGSLTPYTFELGYPLLTLVYDTLLWRDRDGVPQPWLATSVEPSADGRRVAVRIAEGVRWHDGAPLTAEDVAFTFRYVAGRHHDRFTRQLEPIARVEVVGDHEVLIVLDRPSPGFLDQPLADLPILPAHLWRSLGSGEVAPPGLAVGSGPYRLVGHEPGASYSFEASPGYFRGRPAVDRIDVPIIDRAEATFRALERREVDMLAVSLPELATERLDSLGIRVLQGPSYLGTALVLNTRRAPFDRPEVRAAVAKSLDLRRIAGAVGDATAAEHGYLHPESPWAPEEPLHVFDETAARATLGRVTTPLAVTVVDNDPVKLEAARQVALALTRGGMTAEAQPLPPSEFRAALEGASGSGPSFTAAIDVVPPLASYDPDFLRYLFLSDPRVASFNLSGYTSAAFDALGRQIAATLDAAERKRVVVEALQVLAADAPAVPLFFANGAYAFRPAIYDGWTFVKGSGVLDKRSFVEPARSPAAGSDPVAPAPDADDLPLLALAAAAVGGAVVLAVIAVLLGRRRSA